MKTIETEHRKVAADCAADRREVRSLAQRSPNAPSSRRLIQADPAGGPAQPAAGEPPKDRLARDADRKMLVACRFRLAVISTEAKKRIVEVQQLSQEITNRIWARWTQESLDRGKDVDLRIFLGLYKLWIDGGKKGERPKLDFYAVDSGFEKKMSAELAEAYPTVHSRVRALTLRNVVGHIKNNPAGGGSRLKLWQAVLLSHRQPADSRNPIAVAFDRQNADVEWRDGEVWLSVRLDRFEVEGKVNGGSTLDSMRLLLGNLKSWYCRYAIEAAQALREWRGSKIWYDKRRRMFFVALTIVADQPATLSSDAAATATLESPEKDACWRLTLPKKTVEIGSGRSVEYLRRRLAEEKKLRSDNSFLSPARNGHGRKRLLAGQARLTGRWANKTKTWNQQAVARILKESISGKVASIVCKPPTEKSLLNFAGAEFGPHWPVFQFNEILERKCLAAGIKLRFFEEETNANTTIAQGCDLRDG